jgi:hypothetical protein
MDNTNAFGQIIDSIAELVDKGETTRAILELKRLWRFLASFDILKIGSAFSEIPVPIYYASLLTGISGRTIRWRLQKGLFRGIKNRKYSRKVEWGWESVYLSDVLLYVSNRGISSPNQKRHFIRLIRKRHP